MSVCVTTVCTLLYMLYRSYVYTNTPTDGGWLVYCQDKLLMRRTDADDKTEEPFCAEMDRSNLRVSPVQCWVSLLYCGLVRRRAWSAGVV